MYGYEAPERREAVKIDLKLDKSAYDRHRIAMTTLGFYVGEVRDDDKVKVSYEFAISYYGGIVRQLVAVHDLISDESIVREVKVEELIHGRSVILEVVARLTRLIDKLEGNPCPTPSKRSWWQRLRGSSPAGS